MIRAMIAVVLCYGICFAQQNASENEKHNAAVDTAAAAPVKTAQDNTRPAAPETAKQQQSGTPAQTGAARRPEQPAAKYIPGVNHPGITVETGFQATAVDGKKTSGFQQYTDIPRGADLRSADILLQREGSPILFRLHALDLVQRDMLIRARFEKIGRLALKFDWDGFSRFWGGQGRSIMTQQSTGFWVVADPIRSALEAATAAGPATLIPLASTTIANAPQIQVRSIRERASFTQSYNLGQSWNINLNVLRERRGGDKLSGYGTFIRHGTTPGDVFEVPGQELIEPTRYATTEFGAAVTFTRSRVVASVEYRGSFFDDRFNSLIYENPFRITPGQATPPPTIPTPNNGGISGGGANRGNFTLNQLALPPDSQAHTVSGMIMFLLPRATKLSALVSWERFTQNQPFLPYTLNPAITVNTPAPAIPPVPPQPTAPITTVAALPKPSLQGVIDTVTQDYVFTTRPVRALQLTARYNDYDLDNQTPPIVFPGYASVGNSFWSYYRTGTPGRPNVLIATHNINSNRQKAKFEAAIKPVDAWTVKAAYQWQHWNRFNRETNDETEHGFLSSVSYAPKSPLYVEVGFNYYDRTPNPYFDPFGLEHPDLRMYDEAKRIRKEGNAVLSYSVTPKVVLSGSYFYTGDAYDKTLLGLHQWVTSDISFDASFNIAQNFGFFAGYGFQRDGYSYQGLTGPALPPPDPYFRDTRDHFHSARVGFTGSFMNGKGDVEATYELGYANTRIQTTNLTAVLASHQTNSLAFVFPDVSNEFNSFRLNTSYQVGQHVRLGLYYMLEPYRLNDFSYNTMAPYGVVNTFQNDASRYYFLDVGPTNYTGNVAAVYLRFSF